MMKSFFFLFIFVVGKSTCFDPTKHKNWHALPHKTCGQAASGRIIGGEEAPMNAYPWLARLGYSSRVVHLKFLCGGTVVNSKTILTAAHCIKEIEHGFRLSIIRLGEHDTTTNPDCDGRFCADPIMDFEPAEFVLRQDYNTPIFKNDIALIRLKTNIQFSDFIKPICFPTGGLNTRNPVGGYAEVAGWGITDSDTSTIADLLQVVRLPVIKNSECSKVLPSVARMGPTQLCVGGTVGKDSCAGDSGGPLMMLSDERDQPRYYVIGIVSFGSRRCGKTRAPGVYTKVAAYMEWILNNLVKNDGNSVVLKILV